MKAILTVLLWCALAARAAVAQAATKSGFIKTPDGVRIHYVEAGQGRPLVLVPGWLVPGWIWQPQIDALSGQYRVIAVDPRSQGESDRPAAGHLPEERARDYKALVDQLGLERPVLVGWSMACGELLSYVAQFGEDNVGGVVLVDGLIPPDKNPAVATMLSQGAVGFQQDRHKAADTFVRSIYQQPQPKEYLQRVARACEEVPTDTAATLIYDELAVNDFSAAFARITRPLLFVYEPLLQANADSLKARLGDRLRLERFDEAGHALFVDDPTRFNRVLTEFVQGLPE